MGEDWSCWEIDGNKFAFRVGIGFLVFLFVLCYAVYWVGRDIVNAIL
jgi:hypothetical protein